MVPLFSLRQVSLRSGATTILDDISIEIPDEGVTAITGPSGAGKSSFLRLLNRLEIASRGTVQYRGRDLLDLEATALRRQVGMVFQKPALFAGTLSDNLRIARPGLSGVEISGALERVGLDTELAERAADRLSGGEAQRLCIARALLVEPAVLLLDEATSALDAASATTVEKLLSQLGTQGLRQIWVSHDPEQVARVATHEIKLEPHGRGASIVGTGL